MERRRAVAILGNLAGEDKRKRIFAKELLTELDSLSDGRSMLQHKLFTRDLDVLAEVARLRAVAALATREAIFKDRLLHIAQERLMKLSHSNSVNYGPVGELFSGIE